MFKIVASDTEKAGIKIFSTSEKEGERLLEKYDYDYELLIENIRFRGTQIVLDYSSMEANAASIKRENKFSQKNSAQSHSADSDDRVYSPIESGREDTYMKEMMNIVDGQIDIMQQTGTNQKGAPKQVVLPLKNLSNFGRDSKKEGNDETNKLTFRGQNSDRIDEDMSYK